MQGGRIPFEIVEGWRPGALGRIVELHGDYYHRQAGFGRFFEAKVARELAFCRANRWPGCHLWTFAGLDAARHLYEKHGFVLAEQRRGAQWGVEVAEQRFELDLPVAPAAQIARRRG